LIPIFFTDEIEIVSGGISALYGSGAIGGLIQLSSGAKFENKFGVDIFGSAGSFSNFSSGESVHYSNKKYAGTFRYFKSSGRNNFSYTNTAEYGDPIVFQHHAKAVLNGFSQENSLKMGKKQTIQTFLLFQESDREIPPTMTQQLSNKSQKDKNLRFAAEWNFDIRAIKFNFRSALLFTEMNYIDTDLPINSTHQSVSNITELQGKFKMKNEKNLLHFGLNNTVEKGFSSDLDDHSQRDRLSIFAAFRTSVFKRILLSFNLREEVIFNNFGVSNSLILSKPNSSKQFSLPTFGTYFQFKPTKNLNVSASFTRNYRVPTFNELFWKDYAAEGNADLKSESSYSQEIGFEYFISEDKSKFLKLTVFNSSVSDMIQWMPFSGVWKPVNQQNVWSRGIETKMHYSHKINKLEIKYKVSYTFTKSTLELESNSVFNHKQLIFTPQQIGLFVLEFKYSHFTFELSKNFVGHRFENYSPDEILVGYSLSNCGIFYQKEIKNNTIIIGFQALNVLNAEYQVMPSYPNPGRNYQLTFRYKFSLKNENNN
jgi:outer membrane cobalamin receptor